MTECDYFRGNNTKTQGGNSDAVVVPCVIKLESGCMFESDVAQEQVL